MFHRLSMLVSPVFTSGSIDLDTEPPGQVPSRLQEGGGGLFPEPAPLPGSASLRVLDVLGAQPDGLPRSTESWTAGGDWLAHSNISN